MDIYKANVSNISIFTCILEYLIYIDYLIDQLYISAYICRSCEPTYGGRL